MSKQTKKFFSFFHRRIFVLIAIAAVIIIFISTSYYEYATEPQAPMIPAGIFDPANYQKAGWYNFGFNGTIYPEEYNVSGKSYAATFEIMPGPPYLVTSGTFNIQAAGISITNKTTSGAYSNASFYISAASLTIGNYTTDNYELSANNGHIFVNFHEGGYNFIGSVDKPGTNYTGQLSITITPVLYLSVYLSMYHFKEKPFTLKYKIEHPWYRVSSRINEF